MSQYFENDNKLKSERRKITIKIDNISFEMITDNGTFSKEKLDYGTRLLLETRLLLVTAKPRFTSLFSYLV